MNICTSSKYKTQRQSAEPDTTVSTLVHTHKHKTRSVYLHVYTCIHTLKKTRLKSRALHKTHVYMLCIYIRMCTCVKKKAKPESRAATVFAKCLAAPMLAKAPIMRREWCV